MVNALFEEYYDNYYLCPLPNDALELYYSLECDINKDIIELYKNKTVKLFHPEKIQTSNLTFSTTIKGYENKTTFNHFVFEMNTLRLIGMIELISTKGIEEIYPNLYPIFELYQEFNNTWIIEYWLNEEYWNKSIMSYFVPVLCNLVFKNTGAKSITALCNPYNYLSVNFAKKCGFRKVGQFSENQYHYILTPENIKMPKM